jgi:exodeoxyribonuclease-5
MELSKLQLQCVDDIMSWFNGSNTKQTFILSGVAGSGKTTLIAHIRNLLSKNIKIAFGAYTGKASSVLRSKLQKFNINRFEDDSISTIHALIYEPPLDDDLDINEMKWILKSDLEFDFLIIDECSMIPKKIYDELLSFNKKILFVGDAFQLPSVDDTFNLLSGPIDFKLHEVHRFALENPLTKISIMAREEGYVPHGRYGEFVIKVRPNDPLITKFIDNIKDFENTIILCGFNKTRIDLNQKIRARKKIHGIPQTGERIICLKNNRHAKRCPIYNGVIGTLKSITENFDHYRVSVKIDGEDQFYHGSISKKVFNNEKPEMNEYIFVEDEDDNVDNVYNHYSNQNRTLKKRKIYLDCFDFASAATVHKSQGSEFNHVLLIEQVCSYWSGDLWNRWLYTGITRSRNELLIVR